MGFGTKLLLAAVIYSAPSVLAFLLGSSGSIIVAVGATTFFSIFGYFLSLIGMAGYYGAWSRRRYYESPERVSIEQSDPAAANKIDQMPSFKEQTFGQTITQIVSVWTTWFVIFASAFVVAKGISAQPNPDFYFEIFGFISLIWVGISWKVRKMSSQNNI